MTIEWKRKLSSRKLWLAFSLFVSGILSFWLSDEIVAKIVSAIMQGASVIGYIVGEGLVDAAHKGVNKQEEPSAAQPETVAETQTSAIGFEIEPVYNTEGEGKGD